MFIVSYCFCYFLVFLRSPINLLYLLQIDTKTLILTGDKAKERSKPGSKLASSVQEIIPTPCPRFPLAIIWSPDRVFFDLDKKPIIHKLW